MEDLGYIVSMEIGKSWFRECFLVCWESDGDYVGFHFNLHFLNKVTYLEQPAQPAYPDDVLVLLEYMDNNFECK